MIDLAVGSVNRNASHGGPARAGGIERVGDNDIVGFAGPNEAAVRPDYVDRASAVDLSRRQGTLAQATRDCVVIDRCDGGSGTPAYTAIGGIESANGSFISICSWHDHGAIRA